MRTHLPRIVFAAALLAAVAGSAIADIPRAIPLQVLLKDSAGRPITNATQFVALSIYNVATGGAALYTETKTVAVTNGLCATTIGTGNPAGFAALPFDVPYWIGIRVGGDAETSPRIALASAPYALNTGSVAYTAVTGAPTSLPPSGAAGGDLEGTYPNPAVRLGAIDHGDLALDIESIDRVTNERMAFSYMDWEDQASSGTQQSGALPAWQSFTPSMTGYLQTVKVYIGSTTGLGLNTTLRIYEGEGTGGVELFSQAVNVQPTVGTQTYYLHGPVMLTKGSKYTWYLAAAAGSKIHYSETSGYTGGRAGLNAAWDYYFRTTMSPHASYNRVDIWDFSAHQNGIFAASDFTDGVNGWTRRPGCSGIQGRGNSALGSYAGTFYGDVRVIDGDLSVAGTLTKGAGSFRIDHPLDPKNKTLSHSFVESPDMMNVYNGNVKTDRKGRAVVRLPDYFQALNRDFRYQLTTIGTFANSMVERKIANNRFVIRTSKPNVEVSWQVTGIRNDAYARDHRIRAEEPKPKEARGTYLYPDGFNKPRRLATKPQP